MSSTSATSASPARVLIRNLLVIGFPNLFQTASYFVRGVILARLLGVHEFGFAVIILSVAAALDIFADAGIDRFIVQSRFGYRPDIVNTSHTFRVAGSSIVGASIVLLSYPLALVFHAPQMWPAIAATGGIVVIRGLTNLSYKLQQRDHRFETETVIDTTRIAIDVIVTAVVAYFTHSYLSVLAGAYANAFAHFAMSHLWYSLPYSFRPRAKLVKLVGRFSVPIYINASMLFAAMQGDRMIVAAMFSKRELALYAVACTVGQGIAALNGKVAEKILLPILAPHMKSREKRQRDVNSVGAIMLLGSVIFLIFMTIAGSHLVRLIYGPAYAGLQAIVSAAAIFQMIQIQQSWMNSVLISNGITSAFPKITLMRTAGFPVAIGLVALGMSILAIPIAFAIGAACSLAMSFYAERSLRLVDRRLMAAAFGIIACAIGTFAWLTYG